MRPQRSRCDGDDDRAGPWQNEYDGAIVEQSADDYVPHSKEIDRSATARMIEQDRGKRSDDGASPSLSIKTTQSDERSEINLDADDVCDYDCGDSGARRNK